MKAILTALVLVLTFSCIADPAVRTIPQRIPLLGKVKTVRTSGYGSLAKKYAVTMPFDNNFYSVDSYSTSGLLAYTHRIKFGKLQGWTDYKYDSTGNQIQESTYDNEKHTALITISKYDSSGNKTEERTYNKKAQLTRLILVKYDTSGKPTEEVYPLNDSIRVIYTYTNGILTMKKYVLRLTKSLYNDKGKLTPNGPNYYHQDSIANIRYTYDDKGLIASIVNTYNNKNVRTIYYTYDANKNIVLTKEVDKEGKTTRSIATEYTYDDQGNWIRCTEDEPDNIRDNEPQQGLHIREIEYY